ncbi:hypothetical protein [uncultured Albimonas sp.]|uniref:hypothetical protein n=1 Tax=uncultured Albimonas sp. TaxID=1331701 RepID=UPI0030EF569B
MTSVSRILGVSALALAATFAADRASALTALTAFEGGTPYSSYYTATPGDMIGWRFSIAAPIMLTALGVLDDGDLVSPHMVGLWGGGTLLASQEIDAVEGTLLSGFYYESITPVALAAGTYTIAAYYHGDDQDSYISGATSTSFDPAVTWLASLYPAGESLGFVEPTLTSGSRGRFGPNFQFSASVVATPLPGAAALLAGGLAAFGALGAARRRRA